MNSKRVAGRYILKRLNKNIRTASSTDMEFVFNNYPDVVEAIVTDPDIMGDLLEDLVNTGELEIERGRVFYQGRQIL